MDKQIEPKKNISIEDIEKAFNDVYLLEDKGVIRISIATLISNRLFIADKPVWLILLAGSSSGKCLGKNTPIIMYDGTVRKVEDIKIGDLLMGDDSTPRKVLSTTSGTDTMYRVIQEKGDNYIVNSSHVLTMKYTSNEVKYKGIKINDVIDINLPNYLKKSETFKRKFKGFKVGIELSKKQVMIDPYFLGIWLGDGDRNSMRIHKSDIEIKNFVKRYAKQLNMEYSFYKDKREDCSSHSIVRRKGTKFNNPLKSLFAQYNLINTQKFIPKDYLQNDRGTRLQVLAGILDTDGYLDDKKKSFEFSNKSRQLALDVVFLARSLGFHASINKTIKQIKSIGFSGTYWRVYIGGDIHLIPTKIARKKAKKVKRHRGILSCGIKVKKIGRGKYYGFELDGNGRFLLGDFTVTHNTAILQTFDNVGDWIVPVDTLTTNTFASGLARSDEVSLLHKANRGVLVLKDMTTLTSMNEEALREILGQLRAIFDGSFDKKTGNGQDVHWVGKLGIIAGGTIAVQHKMRQFSVQGERFINYCIKQPNAIEMTRRAVDNQTNMKEKEDYLKEIVKNFIIQVISGGMNNKFIIPNEIKEDLIAVSDFATLSRSPVILDKKTNKVAWVPEREMPSRMAIQLINLAKSLMIMSDEKELSNKNAEILYQCAFDSIPVERRLVMKMLTQYKMASTKNLAIHLNYPTDPVLSWCAQLNARKIIDRMAKGDGTSDAWIMKEEYRAIVSKFEKMRRGDETLVISEEQAANYSADDGVVVSDATLLDRISDEADDEFNSAFNLPDKNDVNPDDVPI